MLAACGIAEVDVVRRPKVAVLSTGDELVRAGRAAAARRGLRLQRRDHRGRRRAKRAASRSRSARFRTTRRRSKPRCARALAACDMVVLSGGTSKGAGDLSHRIVSRLGAPGVIVHGVALKPGKPLCLAVADGKPIVVLPGFPTSAIFTFHAFVAPVIRAKAGLPPEAAVHGRGDGAGAHPVRARPQGIRAGRAGRGRGRPDRVSARQGLGLGHDLLAGRRLPRDRRAAHRARCRHATQGDADRAGGARARSRDRGQPLRRARRGARRARRAGHLGAHHRDRQPWAASPRRGAANAISRRCICRSGDRHLQRASARRPGCRWCGLAAHAGHRVPRGRCALRGQDRAGRARRPRSPIPTA